MGKIKNAEKEPKGTKHELTEREVNYIKLVNISCQFNVYKDKIISGYLCQVCNNRFGYNENQNLVFEIDLEKEDNLLYVREVPTEAIKAELEKN